VGLAETDDAAHPLGNQPEKRLEDGLDVKQTSCSGDGDGVAVARPTAARPVLRGWLRPK
jgi:hypothetical protein